MKNELFITYQTETVDYKSCMQKLGKGAFFFGWVYYRKLIETIQFTDNYLHNVGKTVFGIELSKCWYIFSSFLKNIFCVFSHPHSYLRNVSDLTLIKYGCFYK